MTATKLTNQWEAGIKKKYKLKYHRSSPCCVFIIKWIRLIQCRARAARFDYRYFKNRLIDANNPL